MGEAVLQTERQSPDKPVISPEDYRKILAGLSLSRLSLAACEAKADLRAVEAVKELPLRLSERASLEAGNGGAVMRHGYSLLVRSGQKTLVSIKADYLLEFTSVEPVTPEFFEIFRQIALPMYTWPYLRELVGSMTARMDIPKLLLPLRPVQS